MATDMVWTIACVIMGVLAVGLVAAAAGAADPLPSWNDRAAKKAIVEFVTRVTTDGSPDFVPAAERIAVFDNDGTLWSEQPIYFQAAFTLDRIKALAPQHPEWKEQEPFASLLRGDLKAALAGGEPAVFQILMATHAGMTTDEFAKIVAGLDRDGQASEDRPALHGDGLSADARAARPTCARAASRPSSSPAAASSSCGPGRRRSTASPPSRSSAAASRRSTNSGTASRSLVRLPEMDFYDDKAGKPVGINSHIGRRPIAAFGNSDGDHQMLQWTAAGGGARFMGLVHHTDAEREWAYDRASSIGRLDKALDEAQARDWTVISMKDDWKRIFPFDTIGK